MGRQEIHEAAADITWHTVLFYLKKYFIYLCLDRGKGREKERERDINVRLLLMSPPTGDLACNLGMCPGWELNPSPFGLQACTQSTEPHQPGQAYCFTANFFYK